MSVPPVFGQDVERGVREMLDSLIMRYTPSLQSVLLSYSHLTFPDPFGATAPTAAIIGDNPFSVVDVRFEAGVWKPEVGMKLVGTHSLSSPSHISLLLYKTFNVSIPISHIPTEHYEFDHSIGTKKLTRSGTPSTVDSEDSDSELDDDEEEGGEHSQDLGRWVDKRTGRVVGDDDEGVMFTVVSLQISNQMLSLTGSLLPDPSNPRDAPNVIVPVAPDSQIAREGLADAKMANGAGGDVSERRKRKKEKQKASMDGAIAVQTPKATDVVKEEDVHDADAAAAKAAKRERKEARRLAKKATAVAGGLVVDPATDDKTDEPAEMAPAADAVESGKKHRKRKADAGGGGESEGKHKKRKKDVASL